jgi:D-alanyl-D-alanine carboxypeptidase
VTQRRKIFFVFTLLAAISFAFPPAYAATGSTTQDKSYKSKTKSYKIAKNSKRKVRRVAKRSLVSSEAKFSALVVDAETGKVLYEKNAGNTRYPASLTKMMTLYLTFEALKSGKLTMDDSINVSAKAAGQAQTNISLNPGENLPVRTAIESVVVRSANDSAMALAEALGGTEWNFALMMTQKAHELGMKNTVFRNPNGLPDNKQHTTAYDMARLGIALRRDFPEYYPFFKLTSFTYNNIEYPGHNRVMERYDGADGIKTGYIRSSGFNLVTSVKRDRYNIVGVIMGGKSAAARDNQMIAMLNQTFAKLESPNQLAANDNNTKKNYLFISDANAADDNNLMVGQGGYK